MTGMGILKGARKHREDVAIRAAQEAAENEDRYLLFQFSGGQTAGKFTGKVGGGLTQVIEAIEEQGYTLRDFNSVWNERANQTTYTMLFVRVSL